MFALRVTYLTGRVYSARFEDGDTKSEPEWPPHPSRLFSALVAAWGEGGAEPELLPALKAVEDLGAPTIYAGDCTPRKLVRASVPLQVFVPVNDDRSVPEDRVRKKRAFPSATVSPPDVYFVWEGDLSANLHDALSQILDRTCSLGHSSSLVEVAIADELPLAGYRSWHPDAPNGERLRVPYTGRLQELIDCYQRFEKDPNKIHRPRLGRTAIYASPVTGRPAAPQGPFDRMIVLRRDAGPRGSLRSTLSVTAAMRGAMIALTPEPVPEYVSGHAPGSTREHPNPSQQPHLAFVPLPFAGAPHATGELLGVALLLPQTLGTGEREICWEALSRVEELRMPWGRWEVSLTDAEERRYTLQPERWAQKSRAWSTVTPFVFDRYPKDPHGQEAGEFVVAAFERAGFPAPVAVEIHSVAWHLGVPLASAFPPAPARPGKPQRYHAHVRAQFDQDIGGPVVAGAGRFYGYGLFCPHRTEGAL